MRGKPRRLEGAQRGLIASALAALLLLYASSIIVFDVVGDHTRFSNRSLAVPAFGLAVVSVWYLTTKYPRPRGWLRLVALAIAVSVCYLIFGAALLGISLLVQSVAKRQISRPAATEIGSGAPANVER